MMDIPNRYDVLTSFYREFLHKKQNLPMLYLSQQAFQIIWYGKCCNATYETNSMNLFRQTTYILMSLICL